MRFVLRVLCDAFMRFSQDDGWAIASHIALSILTSPAKRQNMKTNVKQVRRFKIEDVEEAMDCYMGFCVSCGAPRECCEPDARNYPCEECGEKQVYGAQELIMMNLVE